MAVDALADQPRPPKSKQLDIPAVDAEVRRLRLDRWPIVNAITESALVVAALAIRKRPPYDYSDMESLLKDFPTK